MIFGALVLSVLAAAAPSGLPVVAVWDVKPIEGVTDAAATILSDLIGTELAESGRVTVMARNDLIGVLGYQKYRQSMGCTEQECMAGVGGQTGAAYVLSGQVGKLGSQYRLSLVLMDAKKGEAVSRVSEFCAADGDALAATTKRVVAKVAGAFPATRGGAAGAGAAVVGTGPEAEKKVLEAADQLMSGRKYAEAAKAYEDFLSRFPTSESRCRALAGAGSAWEKGREPDPAATKFMALGTDPVCASANPNGAAMALDKAATLFDTAGRSGDARAAREKLVKLPGVTSSEIQFRIQAAKAQLEMGFGEMK
jgi:TolB-like protein